MQEKKQREMDIVKKLLCLVYWKKELEIFILLMGEIKQKEIFYVNNLVDTIVRKVHLEKILKFIDPMNISHEYFLKNWDMKPHLEMQQTRKAQNDLTTFWQNLKNLLKFCNFLQKICTF